VFRLSDDDKRGMEDKDYYEVADMFMFDTETLHSAVVAKI
jgi:hypothetical protein